MWIKHPHVARAALAEKRALKKIWAYDIEGSYHDVDRCECEGHCRNCFADLDEIRDTRTRMIAAGTIPASGQLSARERYCSRYCRGRAQRERALDRAISAVTASKEES
jgi:hypothetical protein